MLKEALYKRTNRSESLALRPEIVLRHVTFASFDWGGTLEAEREKYSIQRGLLLNQGRHGNPTASLI